MAPKRVLTAEQLALQEERRLKKERLAAATQEQSSEIPEKAKIIERHWHQLEEPVLANSTRRVKVLTWNLLAQCLVRRELFPNSDCLKASQREHMIYREILACKADILCLQEVDRLEKLLPVLEEAGYSYHYASGPKKKHGCLIAYNRDLYEISGNRTIYYDEQEVHTSGDDDFRRGLSFRTKNIANLVSLEPRKGGSGLIIATTHLFWHPKYIYERARQAGILKREVVRFRDEENRSDWPCIIAGDFNFTPDDPGYALVVGDSLLPAQIEQFNTSRVVHSTIDASLRDGAPQKDEEEGESEAPDPDRVIVHARSAVPSDGLLSVEELQTLLNVTENHFRSVYDTGLKFYKETRFKPTETNPKFMTYGERRGWEAHRPGFHEPQWTSYTHYWQNSIGEYYIFVLDPPGIRSTVGGLLSPPSTKDLEPGIPRMGVCGSDHVSLCAELLFVH